MASQAGELKECRSRRLLQHKWLRRANLRDPAPHKIPDFLRHARLLLLRKLGKHGQGNDFGGDLFGLGEISPSVTQVLVCLLQVEWDGIVNPGVDVGLLEMSDQSLL